MFHIMENSEIKINIWLVKIHILLIHRVLLTIYFQQHKHRHFIHRPNLIGYHKLLHHVEFIDKCLIFKTNIHHNNEHLLQLHPKEYIDSHPYVKSEDLHTHHLKWHITGDFVNRLLIRIDELKVHRKHIDMMQWMAQATIHRIIQTMEAMDMATHK